MYSWNCIYFYACLIIYRCLDLKMYGEINKKCWKWIKRGYLKWFSVFSIHYSCFSHDWSKWSVVGAGGRDFHWRGHSKLQLKDALQMLNDQVISERVFDIFLSPYAGCPVNFEFLNYTIITSQCKGPQYSPKLCCGAFKDFACPYSAELNDLTNDCASTMFSYINLYGKYPPGLFASECQEGKEGLECPAQAPSTESAKDSVNASRGQIVSSYSMLTLLAGFLVLLFHLFWKMKYDCPHVLSYIYIFHLNILKIHGLL